MLYSLKKLLNFNKKKYVVESNLYKQDLENLIKNVNEKFIKKDEKFRRYTQLFSSFFYGFSRNNISYLEEILPTLIKLSKEFKDYPKSGNMQLEKIASGLIFYNLKVLELKNCDSFYKSIITKIFEINSDAILAEAEKDILFILEKASDENSIIFIIKELNRISLNKKQKKITINLKKCSSLEYMLSPIDNNIISAMLQEKIPFSFNGSNKLEHYIAISYQYLDKEFISVENKQIMLDFISYKINSEKPKQLNKQFLEYHTLAYYIKSESMLYRLQCLLYKLGIKHFCLNHTNIFFQESINVKKIVCLTEIPSKIIDKINYYSEMKEIKDFYKLLNENCVNENSTISKILNEININNNKKLCIFLEEKISKEFDFDFFFTYINFNSENKFNENILFNILNKKTNLIKFTQNSKVLSDEFVLMKDFIERLLLFYSTSKVLNIIFLIFEDDNFNLSYLRDTHYQLNKIIVFNESTDINQDKIKMISNPKNLKEIHDNVSLLARQIQQRNFKLNGQERLIELQKETDGNLTIEVPLKNHSLIKIGQELNICVGGGSYADSINCGNCYIINIIENNKMKYCIEINTNDFSIKQAKGVCNSEVNQSDLNWIDSVLSKFYKEKLTSTN
jgi:hypothetical protein